MFNFKYDLAHIDSSDYIITYWVYREFLKKGVFLTNNGSLKLKMTFIYLLWLCFSSDENLKTVSTN